MTMNLKQALARIAELERRVRELESVSRHEVHYQTHNTPAPLLSPQPMPAYDPYRWYPPMPITCGTTGGLCS